MLALQVESTFSNSGVPRTDAEAAALSPHNYFEFHWKLRLPEGYDHDALVALVTPHAARLSRSALRKVANGFEHRFVTMRLYDIGRDGALVLPPSAEPAIVLRHTAYQGSFRCPIHGMPVQPRCCHVLCCHRPRRALRSL